MASTAKRSSRAAKSQFEFKVVTFGDGEEHPSSFPLRLARGELLPFIVSSINNRFHDCNTQTYIRKHVMKNYAKKGNKVVLKANVKYLPLRNIEESRDFSSLRKTLNPEKLMKLGEITGVGVPTLDKVELDRRYVTEYNAEPNSSPGSILGAGRVDP
jgi:hypothetical protein